MAPRSSLVALVGVLLALAGCGSSSSTTATTGTTAATSAATTAATAAAGEHLSLEANREGQLKYNTTSLTARAGKVSIDFTNMASLSHDVTLESSSHAILGATPIFQGGSRALTLDLKPGVYKFFCSVPGHRMAGMEGTLTVK